MAQPKRHLLVRGTRAACGLKDPQHYTDSAAEVTCLGCARTLQMADAEIAQSQRRPR